MPFPGCGQLCAIAREELVQVLPRVGRGGGRQRWQWGRTLTLLAHPCGTQQVQGWSVGSDTTQRAGQGHGNGHRLGPGQDMSPQVGVREACGWAQVWLTPHQASTEAQHLSSKATSETRRVPKRLLSQPRQLNP